jgi:hypothetical protein
MQKFRIIYFRESVLDHAEEVEAFDVLEAIDRVKGKAPDIRAEIWADDKRVCEIGPAPHS